MDLAFGVPVRWSGFPFAEGSVATSWLGPDGEVEGSEAPAEALRFRFRDPTMRDGIAIERRQDDLMGGAEKVVELDAQVSGHWLMLRERYERVLWPEGRPAEPEEGKARIDVEAEINRLYTEDVIGRFVLERLRRQQRTWRVLAEWDVLICDPPAGWATLDGKPEREAAAVVAAYLHYRGKADEGKLQRSGP